MLDGMRAVWLKEFGGPEALVIADAPEPIAGPGQVLIETMYANITFVDTQIRAGSGPFTPDLPMIPGNGVGGVITAAADQTLVGERVISATGGSGGYAERVAVDAAGVFAPPTAVGLDAAV